MIYFSGHKNTILYRDLYPVLTVITLTGNKSSSFLSVTCLSSDCSCLCSLSLLCCGVFLHCHRVWFHGPDDDQGSSGVKETGQPDEVSSAPPHILHHGRCHHHQGVWKRRCIQEKVSVSLMILGIKGRGYWN